MVRFYSSVDSDDVVLIRQAMSRDGAFHDTPHQSPAAALIRGPNARQAFPTVRVYPDSCRKFALFGAIVWHLKCLAAEFPECTPDR
jgi:hypothetical protein